MTTIDGSPSPPERRSGDRPVGRHSRAKGVVVTEVSARLGPGRVGTIEALTKGINNSNYLVNHGDERAEERLPGPDTELLGIDRGNEVDRLAAAIGVGPEIVLVDDATD